MRFLKTKIALAHALKARTEALQLHCLTSLPYQAKIEVQTDAKDQDYRLEISTSGSESESSSSAKKSASTRSSHSLRSLKRNRIVGFSFTPLDVRATKNIVKNYAQAICKFILSSMALPYLNKFINQELVTLYNFLAYIKSIQPQIKSLHHFRAALLTTQTDSEEIASYKSLLVKMGEVFIKFFSVNWIYHSKIVHKDAHMKYRFRMLRRIKNPEAFTKLKSQCR